MEPMYDPECIRILEELDGVVRESSQWEMEMVSSPEAKLAEKIPREFFRLLELQQGATYFEVKLADGNWWRLTRRRHRLLEEEVQMLVERIFKRHPEVEAITLGSVEARAERTLTRENKG